MCSLVLENIRFHAGIAAKQSKVYLDMLTEMKEFKRQEEVSRIKKELKSVDKRLAQLDKILSKLYEDYALDKIDESRYNSMSSGYAQETSESKYSSTLEPCECPASMNGLPSFMFFI